MRFDPRDSIVSVTDFSNPLPKPIRDITDKIPITIPNRVSPERSLFVLREFKEVFNIEKILIYSSRH